MSMTIQMTPQQFADKKAQLKAEQGIELVGNTGAVQHGDFSILYTYECGKLTVTVSGGGIFERTIATAKISGWLKSAPSGVATTGAASVAVLLIASIFSLALAGCTPQQQTDFKSAVAKVGRYEPEVATAVDTLSATLETFVPEDALLISASQGVFDGAAAELKTLCDAYAATPNTGTLASIRSTLETLLTTNASQMLAAARISNPTSMATAKLALGGIRTILLLMDAAFQTAQTPAQTAAILQARPFKLADAKPWLDRGLIERETGRSFDQVYAYETSLGA